MRIIGDLSLRTLQQALDNIDDELGKIRRVDLPTANDSFTGTCRACGQAWPGANQSAAIYGGLGALPLPKEGEEDAPKPDGPCQHCGADMDTPPDDLFHSFVEVGFLPGELQTKIAKLQKKYRFAKRSDD